MLKPNNYDQLKTFYHERRGARGKLPDASIVITVNTQGDLETALGVLGDTAKYKGR